LNKSTEAVGEDSKKQTYYRKHLFEIGREGFLNRYPMWWGGSGKFSFKWRTMQKVVVWYVYRTAAHFIQSPPCLNSKPAAFFLKTAVF